MPSPTITPAAPPPPTNAPGAGAEPTAANLTPKLNELQLRQNISALQKSGMNNIDVQKYADNYLKAPDGTYTLKSGALVGAPPSDTPGVEGEDDGGGGDDSPGAPDSSFTDELGNQTGKQMGEGAQHVVSSVEEGADLMGKGGVKNVAEGALRSGLGSASGALQTLFAPVSGAIQTIGDKLGDSKALQDFATGNKTAGGILDSIDNLQSGWDAFSKAHPDAASNLGDAANVLMAALGEKAPIAGEDAGAAISAPGKALADFAGPAGPGGRAAQAVVDSGKNALDAAKQGMTRAPATAGTAEAAKAGVSNVGTALKSAYSQIYGLPANDIDFLIQHPEYANPESLSNASLYNLGKQVEGKIAESKTQVPAPQDLGKQVQDALQTKAQALREHGMKYPTGNNSGVAAPKTLVKVDPAWLHDQLVNPDVAGVEVAKDGTITHGSADSKINPVDSPEGARRLQALWDTWQPKFAAGKMTGPDFIRFRQSLAGLADYKGGVDTVLKKSADAMRDNFNSTYRPQIKGLDALDAEHTKMIGDFEDSMKGIATQDPMTGKVELQDGALNRIMNATKDTNDQTGQRLAKLVPGILNKVQQAKSFASQWHGLVDENGNLQENALNNIKNSVNAGRDVRLDKLEGLMPGITNKIKLVKAAENYSNTLGLKPGKYATGAAVSQVFTGNPLVGLAAIYASSPQVGLAILRRIGASAAKGAVK